MTPVDGRAVLGDFRNTTFTKGGVTSTFSVRDGR
jgi:hypothetical protein